MNKLVSVISPVFNGESCIENCIKSVADQTYPNFELVIVNDGSQDNTEEIIKKYQKKYKWIRLISIENHGQGYARNLAIKAAKGEFIAFLDSDDYFDKDMLKKTVERIEKDGSDYLIFDYMLHNIADDSFKPHRIMEFYENDVLEGKEVLKLLKTNAHFACIGLYKKSLLIDNDVKFGEGYIYEDTPFYVKSVISANKVSIMRDILYYYVSNPSSTTRQKLASNKHAVGLIRAATDTFVFLKKSKYTEEEYGEWYSYLFRKYTSYNWRRVPSFYRKQFALDLMDLFKENPPPYVEGDGRLNYFVKHNLFNRSYFIFATHDFISASITKIKEDVFKKRRL